MDSNIIVALISSISTLLGGGIVTFITFLINRHDNRKGHINALEEGVKGLLHDRIITMANFYSNRGYITLAELSDFEKYLYEPYKKLRGNGSAETAYSSLKGLPHNPPDMVKALANLQTNN